MFVGPITLSKGDWKLIEGSGDGDYPRKKNGGGIATVTKVPVRDAETRRWVELDYFGLAPDGKFQLYNLRDDPAEQNDQSVQHPETVRELKTLLDRYRSNGRSR